MLDETLASLNQAWSELTTRMQELRDNPECAREEQAGRGDESDPGHVYRADYDLTWAPKVQTDVRPKMAILREQGINGQAEMAAAFDLAGFESVDVHMTDLLAGDGNLADYAGLVACGGFSYGDVLGAGSGWAKSVLYHEVLKDMFAAFFARPDTFSLGVCNGCQMMSQLKDIIPGAGHWPAFVRNRSEQFEARLALVRVEDSPSVLLSGMAGSHLPIAVAHGEGRAEFADAQLQSACAASGTVALRYIENDLSVAQGYPANPNGSPQGITGLTSLDGRATIMMPHPERVFRTVQSSWAPADWGEDGGWLRLFRNARQWLG